jgi:hypothetical protein
MAVPRIVVELEYSKSGSRPTETFGPTNLSTAGSNVTENDDESVSLYPKYPMLALNPPDSTTWPSSPKRGTGCVGGGGAVEPFGAGSDEPRSGPDADVLPPGGGDGHA